MILDPVFESQLKASGVSFAVTYYGSVPIEISVRDMGTDFRSQLILECIHQVAATLNLASPFEMSQTIQRIVGEVKEENYPIEMNISSKMIKMIRQGSMIQRHPLLTFSLATQGKEGSEIEHMFGYIAKNKTGNDRRCHVLGLPDVTKLLDVLTAAIYIATTTVQSNPSTSASSTDSLPTHPPLNDGFATPTLPVRRIPKRPLSRVDEDLDLQMWYHGSLSREKAHKLLVTPGDFLVRKSDHSPNQYILSGMTDDNNLKHLFLLDEKYRCRTKEAQFDTISELIEHHHMNGKAVQTRVDTALKLIRPIPNPNAT